VYFGSRFLREAIRVPFDDSITVVLQQRPAPSHGKVETIKLGRAMVTGLRMAVG
jgi:hypothetical protein